MKVWDLGLRAEGSPAEGPMPACLPGRADAPGGPPALAIPQPQHPRDGDPGWRGAPAHPAPHHPGLLSREFTWQEQEVKPTAPHWPGPLGGLRPHPPTLAWLQGVLPSRPEKPVCETTQLAGNSSAPWGSLGAVTRGTTSTRAHRAWRAWKAGGGGPEMALTFEWAPRSSTGRSDPRAQLCQCLTRNKSPRCAVSGS